MVVATQAAWYLKGRGLTEQTYVDEVEMEEEGIAELFMDDTAIADVASKHTPLCIVLKAITHSPMIIQDLVRRYVNLRVRWD